MLLRTRSYLERSEELFTITQLSSHMMSSCPLDAKPLFHSGKPRHTGGAFYFIDEPHGSPGPGRAAPSQARSGPVPPAPWPRAESRPGRSGGFHITRAARSGSWGGGGYSQDPASRVRPSRILQYRPCQNIRIYSYVVLRITYIGYYLLCFYEFSLIIAHPMSAHNPSIKLGPSPRGWALYSWAMR